MLVSEALSAWERELLTLQGVAPRTASEHMAHADAVFSYAASSLNTSFGALTLESVRRDHLVGALDAYRKNPKVHSPASVRRRLAALRSFYSWCLAAGILPGDISRTLKVPPVPRSRPKVLSEEECKSVLEAASSSRWPERDRLLVLLMLSSGLRLNEVSDLSVSDVGEQINIAGRVVPASPAVQDALADYLPTRKELLTRYGMTSHKLMLSRNPRGGTVEATTTTLGQALSRILDVAGVSAKGIRAEALRATYATMALSSGSHSPAVLAACLGVRSLETIARYADVSQEALAAAQAAHPFSGGSAARPAPVVEEDEDGAVVQVAVP